MKTVMITGADSGLGYETARKIAKNKDYEVIFACRSLAKAEQAIRTIQSETGNENLYVQILDTSDLESVRTCVNDLHARGIHLDGLVCNAGISPIHSGTTDDGFELVFATNYLGHFLLTMELLDEMNEHARIVHVTSDMHNPPVGIEWKGADYLAYHAQNDRLRYSYSKLCNILFTYRLADELKKKNSSITVNCFNPGFMKETNFSGRPHGNMRDRVIRSTMPARYGTLGTSSDALVSLITDPSYENISGQYIDRQYGIGKSSELSHDKSVQEELWLKSQEYTGIQADEILKQLQK